MNARIIFDKNFADKYKTEKLTNQQKGLLRYKKLEQSAKDGTLQFAKKKNDVAKIVGFSGKDLLTSGYQWVKRVIDNGYLEEVPVGRDQYGLIEYQYTLTTKPYTTSRPRKSYKKKVSEVKKHKHPKHLKPEDRLSALRELAEQGKLEKPMHRGQLGKLIAPELANHSNRCRTIHRLIEAGYLKETKVETSEYWPVFKYEFVDATKAEDSPAKDNKEEPRSDVSHTETQPDETETTTISGGKLVTIKCGMAELTLVDYTAEDIIAIVKGLQ